MYQQLSSGKKIQVPSDNPIIASRALKFRTNISETEQYMRNASQAKSWMGVTEEGFKNTLNLMESIRDEFVRGATDTLTLDDRDKLVGIIKTLAEQIGGEMNVTYAGRYVFSGFRTDIPAIIITDNDLARYNITQDFMLADIQYTKAFVKDDPADLPEIYNIYKIDLPYKGEVKDASGNRVNLAANLSYVPPNNFSNPRHADYDPTNALYDATRDSSSISFLNKIPANAPHIFTAWNGTDATNYAVTT
jgi:flagellin-like hook-associated protein FlgL